MRSVVDSSKRTASKKRKPSAMVAEAEKLAEWSPGSPYYSEYLLSVNDSGSFVVPYLDLALPGQALDHSESEFSAPQLEDCATTSTPPFVKTIDRNSVSKSSNLGAYSRSRSPNSIRDSPEPLLQSTAARTNPKKGLRLSNSFKRSPSVSSSLGRSTQTCPECHKNFSDSAELEAHARAGGHRPFRCPHPNCNVSYARRDLLLRHEAVHKEDTGHPCPRCHKYDGPKAFKRRDHLLQHLSNAHGEEPFPEYCQHSECAPKAGASPLRPFKSMKEYRAHLKEVHGETPFPCDWSGCDRKGKKGYARKRDLEAHKLSHARNRCTCSDFKRVCKHAGTALAHIASQKAVFCSVHQKTVLHLAAEHGLIDIVELLVDGPTEVVDKKAKDSDGRTAYQCALDNGHTKVCKLIGYPETQDADVDTDLPADFDLILADVRNGSQRSDVLDLSENDAMLDLIE